MVDNISHQYLIGSHIIPWKICMKEGNELQAWDKDNGLLLNRNLDALFDKGKISFLRDGKIKLSNDIEKDLGETLIKYQIKNDFLNEKRKTYLLDHNRRHNLE